MTDPNHIPGYDSWKLQAPERHPESTRSQLELFVEVDTHALMMNRTAFSGTTRAVRKAISEHLNIPLEDISIEINLQTQESAQTE